MFYLHRKKQEREGKKENRRQAGNKRKHPLEKHIEVEIDMRGARSLWASWHFGEKQGVENKGTNRKRGNCMCRFEGWEWEATRNTGKSVNIKRTRIFRGKWAALDSVFHPGCKWGRMRSYKGKLDSGSLAIFFYIAWTRFGFCDHIIY